MLAGLRPYYTSNVLRLNDNELSSGVLKPVRDWYPQSRRRSAYLSLVPRLDFLMQWANYQENSVKDLQLSLVWSKLVWISASPMSGA